MGDRIRSENVATILSLGEQGGTGGGKWDDGVFSSIKQVDIVYDYGYIISIRTEYCDDNGNSILSDKHGGNYDGTLNKVVLDYPNEYLVSIHGYMGDCDGYDQHYVIRSLTFESNKRSFGPFGPKRGTTFWFPTTGLVKVVGFHGKSGWFLDSIGIKVVPIHNNTIISSVKGKINA